MGDQPPGDRPQVIMAAPNESRITARVHNVERSPAWSDKWYLELEILNAETVQGANFATPGQRVRAFAFGPEPPALASTTITGRVEYIGGPREGEFKLWDIALARGEHNLTGVVEFHEPPRAFQNARMSVVVEDVSRADAPSSPVARQTLEEVSAGPEGGTLKFSVPVGTLDPRKSYSLSVHIDVDRDGSVSPGDYITTQSYPLTAESTRVAVQVKLVKS